MYDENGMLAAPEGEGEGEGGRSAKALRKVGAVRSLPPSRRQPRLWERRIQETRLSIALSYDSLSRYEHPVLGSDIPCSHRPSRVVRTRAGAGRGRVRKPGRGHEEHVRQLGFLSFAWHSASLAECPRACRGQPRLLVSSFLGFSSLLLG